MNNEIWYTDNDGNLIEAVVESIDTDYLTIRLNSNGQRIRVSKDEVSALDND